MAKRTLASDPDALLKITVGILTYQRPGSLRETLDSLLAAGTITPERHASTPNNGPGHVVTEVVVIDNDAVPSAAQMVASWALKHDLGDVVRHVHEAEPGLAAARNRALTEATNSILVFIDDDEIAEQGWPDGLIEVMRSTGAALVGAPVRTEFDHEPADWVLSGGHFDRDEPPHGSAMPWLRSGNLAIDLTQIEDVDLHFDPRFAFSGGEDTAFSKAALARGLDLRWSAQSAVTEVVGADRTTVKWVTNRARRTTAAYVRASMTTDDSTRAKLSTVARGLIRMAQGAATVLVGAVTLRYGRVVSGLTVLHRGYGFLEGLLGRSGDTYGTTAR